MSCYSVRFARERSVILRNSYRLRNRLGSTAPQRRNKKKRSLLRRQERTGRTEDEDEEEADSPSDGFLRSLKEQRGWFSSLRHSFLSRTGWRTSKEMSRVVTGDTAFPQPEPSNSPSSALFFFFFFLRSDNFEYKEC